MGPPTPSKTNQSDVNENVLQTRLKMKNYWEVYSPTLESMMLSHDAPLLSLEEQEELMDYLPKDTYYNKDVLELGSGIGRYTTLLSDGGTAMLTAVDFMESYIKENEKVNGKKENVRLLCADVTKMNFSEKSFDLVFSNWLFMYLTNEEIVNLLQKCLTWLKPGGYLFFRESCYHQSGNVKRKENPTFYRTPMDYLSMVKEASSGKFSFELIKAKNIAAYVKHYGNPHQLCFLIRKKDSAVENSLIMSPLSSAQSENNHGQFWSTEGGRPLSEFLMTNLESLEGKTVLDVNSGTGGLTFMLSGKADRVVGLTSQAEFLHLTLKNQGALDRNEYKNVTFESCALEDFSSKLSFDAIVCHQIPQQNTDAILAKFTNLLKEGGQLLVTSYSSAEELQSQALEAGFRDIRTLDCSDVMVGALKSALTGASTDVEALSQRIEQLRTREITWIVLQANK